MQQDGFNGALSSPFRVQWEGPFDSPTSFAKVNREVLARLREPSHGHYEASDTAHAVASPAEAPPPDILVSHGIPERLQAPPPPSKWVAILPWDYGLAPQQRVARAEQMDEIWVPSQFCVESYVRSGVPRSQLHVMPSAVDTEVYSPSGPVKELPTDKSFRLLYVGGSLPRKGIDLLLSAYLEAFGPEDDVCLVIKDHGSHGQYAASSLYAEICARTGRADQAEVLIYNDDFWSEADLSALYRACQVYVHPYRGEGFGLPILEAMACGLPCVIPAGGPAPEFCPPSASWQIPVNTHFLRRTPFPDPSYFKEETRLPSFYIEVRRQALISCLQSLPQQREACQRKGQAARAAALAYAWEPIVTRIDARLRALANGSPPRRLQSQTAAERRLKQAQTHWRAGDHLATRTALEQILAAGLSPEAIWAAPAWATRWRPPRIWVEPDLPLREHLPAAWLSPVSEPADLALGSGGHWPSDTPTRILWLQKQPRGVLPAASHCWSAELSWAADFQGPVEWVPEALDFRFFHPYLPTHPHLLSVTRWAHGTWRALLEALALFSTTQPLPELVLVPLGTPVAQAQTELRAWLDTHPLDLRLRLESPPEHAEARRNLFRDAIGFIDSDPEADGSWHLQAQAMGIPCLGAGQRHFLQPPWAQVLVTPADWQAGLSYLLCDKRADYDGLAIREHLQIQHDLPQLGHHLRQLLGKIWLLQALT
ncbi:MAG: glycosyltransferase family 4 protein [Candidatus Sericytochromatia bacterium]